MVAKLKLVETVITRLEDITRVITFNPVKKIVGRTAVELFLARAAAAVKEQSPIDL